MSREEYFEKCSDVINEFLNKPLIDKDYLSDEEMKVYNTFLEICFDLCFEGENAKLENHIGFDGKYQGVYHHLDIARFEMGMAGIITAMHDARFMHFELMVASCLVELRTLHSEFFVLDKNNGWYEWYDEHRKSM